MSPFKSFQLSLIPFFAFMAVYAMISSCEKNPIGSIVIDQSGVCDDEDGCTLDLIDTISGACSYQVTIQADGNLCTDDICVSVNGSANYFNPDVNCNDGDSCTIDSCNVGVCQYAPVDSTCTTPCIEDGDNCTDCTGQPLFCDDSNSCTNDFCLGGSCIYLDVNCDDGNPLTIDECINGVCTNGFKNQRTDVWLLRRGQLYHYVF